jgi:flagellar hook-length control protein FliK
VDVTLSPEELGRVRMSITAGEGGVVLQVLAERPETLELMRRHADLLARELANLGFGSVDLAFGQGQTPQGDAEGDGQAGQGHAAAPDQGREDTAETADDAAPRHMMLGQSGGLDIRL